MNTNKKTANMVALFIKRFVKMIDVKRTVGLSILLIITSIILSCCNIGISISLQSFVDVATGDSLYSLTQVVFVAVVIIIVYAITNVSAMMINTKINNINEKHVRISVLKHLLNVKLSEDNKFHTSDKLTRLTVDIERVVSFVPYFINQSLSEFLSALLGLGTMLLINWKLAIIMLTVVPCITVVLSMITPKQQKAAKIDATNEENNRKLMTELLTHKDLLLVYRMLSRSSMRVSQLYDCKAKSRLRVSLWQGLISFLNNSMGFALLFTTMSVGAYFVTKGEVSVGDLIAMVQMTNYILLPLGGVSTLARRFTETFVSMNRLDELLALDQYPNQCDDSLCPKVKSVHIENLSFSYNDGCDILQDINVEIHKGVNCIIGSNGSGKTTLLKLILGLYEPTQGTIYAVLESGERTSTLGSMGYVPSNHFLFQDTINANIVMEEDMDAEKLKSALCRANVWSLIESLPGKSEYQINEAGGNLSMGQQQRIAIARAIYSNKSVLVFDEPTANLDVESSAMFWETLEALGRDHVCIVVTHDLDMAKNCEHIFSLVDGKIQGDYSE